MFKFRIILLTLHLSISAAVCTGQDTLFFKRKSHELSQVQIKQLEHIVEKIDQDSLLVFSVIVFAHSNNIERTYRNWLRGKSIITFFNEKYNIKKNKFIQLIQYGERADIIVVRMATDDDKRYFWHSPPPFPNLR